MPADPHRPTFHFLPPANWMNDPNGFIQWGSTFHLFYQYNPDAPLHANMHWGHAASEDLVHWRHLPVALAPTPDGPDARGCWSGVTVDNGGTPTIIYSGAVGSRQRACVATSTDGLLTWHKDPDNPVIPEPPPDLDLFAYRDHSVWREDDAWYQVVGSGIRDVGGTALLYRSTDLRNWEYLHPLYTTNQHDPHVAMYAWMWECPDFFELDGSHVLIASLLDAHALHSAAAVGAYHDHRFVPRVSRKLDHGDVHFYAPQSARDSDGRRIVIGWAPEGRSIPAQVAAGWSGCMSLPRELTLAPDGWLRIRPIAELDSLRFNHVHLRASDVPIGSSILDQVRGAALEIDIVLEVPPGGRCAIAVRRAPDASEQTLIVYDAASGQLTLDRTRASLDTDTRADAHTAALSLADGEPLHLRIFVDHSILEVFANDTLSITTRIYPTRPDSLGVALLAGRLSTLDAWQMASIWDDASAAD